MGWIYSITLCCGFESDEQLRKKHQEWVEDALHDGGTIRQPEWTARKKVSGTNSASDR